MAEILLKIGDGTNYKDGRRSSVGGEKMKDLINNFSRKYNGNPSDRT